MAKTVRLGIIDPNNDFMDEDVAALRVIGATADMQRVAGFIDEHGDKLDGIDVTFDSHHPMDYRHPAAWKDSDGNHPLPITAGGPIITADDIRNGDWIPHAANARPWVLGGKTVKEFMIECAEARAKETEGAVPGLEIWPEHCIIGSPGWGIQPDLLTALSRWAITQGATIDPHTKGDCVYTEHYGIVRANVIIPRDPSTNVNNRFLQGLSTSDVFLMCGEAASHCFLATLWQILHELSGGDPQTMRDIAKKIAILEDGTSPVAAVPDGPDFPAMWEAQRDELKSLGVTLTSTTEFRFS